MKKAALFVAMVMVFGVLFAGSALANNVPPEKPVFNEVADMGEDDFVGRDMELREGEMGITAVEVDDEVDYVGKDMELEEGEMGITAVEVNDEEDFVGKDMELAEGEAGIVSIDPIRQETRNNLPLFGGIFTLVAGFSAFIYKKATA